MLKEKKILIGISGSIAAYKCAFLIRLLIKKGADVHVIMTPSACKFITPLTISTLSKNKVHVDVSDGESWDNHVELGLWADIMIIAPATATTLAKMANGIADNMLVASYLSAKCPILFAPAMDLDMWKHGSTISNIEKLLSYGNKMIPVGNGELASGLYGDGRMAEPENIVSYITRELNAGIALEGLKILITAGPTYEALDPVRFIGNHSSGKMGIALAEAAALEGGEVTLVLGPSQLSTENTAIDVINVRSAEEMYVASMKMQNDFDIAILAAAVADFTPKNKSEVKIKKKGDMEEFSLALIQTKDIAKELGAKKRENQLLIGFALETNNEEVNAKRKLVKKNFDFIVLNSLAEKGAGFKHNTNKVTIYHKNDTKKSFSLKSKNEVARDIVNEVIQLLKTNK